jgi:hypothetical protein
MLMNYWRKERNESFASNMLNERLRFISIYHVKADEWTFAE